jgi:flavin-binding protein dodecin
MTTTSKPQLKLTGTNLNAFGLIAAALKAAKRAGWTVEQISEFKVNATKGDFDHLLRTLQQHFDAE